MLARQEIFDSNSTKEIPIGLAWRLFYLLCSVSCRPLIITSPCKLFIRIAVINYST